MNDTVVIDGGIAVVIEGFADCDLDVPEAGEYGIITVVDGGRLPAYTGPLEVVPLFTNQTLETNQKSMPGDVNVTPIPVYFVSNPQGGETAYIGGEFNYG